MTNFYIIKPFSPHLLTYNIQSSSFLSILHRISSLLFLVLILSFFISHLFCSNIYIFNVLIYNKCFYFFLCFFKYFILKLSLFHILNGLKAILWNFNYLENSLILNKINNFLFLCFLCFLCCS